MESEYPGKAQGREIVERVIEGGLGAVPFAGSMLAVTFVTAVNWRLNERREKWVTDLAAKLDKLRERVDGMDLGALLDSDVFVDAVVSATRTIEHAHDQTKIDALRNAVLNSVAPDAPDADTQAMFLNLIDRYTPSHLRMLTLWNDPSAWFSSHELRPPSAAMSGSRTQTVEAGLPEMAGRKDFYLRVANELQADQMLNANLSGMVSATSLMDKLTTDFGRQFVRFITEPDALADRSDS
jgi:hypothetical protein